MEDADTVLNSGLGSHALDGLDDYLLSLLVGIELGVVHNLIDVSGCVELGLIFHALYKAVLGLLGTHSREFLEFGAFLVLHLQELGLFLLKHLAVIVNVLLLLVDILLSAVQVVMLLLKGEFLLFQTVLVLLDTLVALLRLLLKLTLLVKVFLLNFQELFLFQHIGILVGLLHYPFIFPGNNVSENCETDATTCKQCDNGDYSVNHNLYFSNCSNIPI